MGYKFRLVAHFVLDGLCRHCVGFTLTARKQFSVNSLYDVITLNPHTNMATPTAADITNSILDGSLAARIVFYSVWLFVTALGSALGVWISEKVKGRATKDIWFAQEAWKEKYRIYTVVIGATDEIDSALWAILTDVRVLPTVFNKECSSQSDALTVFPEHQQFLDREARALDQIAAVSVGIELMLSKKAQEAIARLGVARLNSAVGDLSYRKRIGIRQTAASETTTMLAEAAKSDLKI
jgi:hypothetical protein